MAAILDFKMAANRGRFADATRPYIKASATTLQHHKYGVCKSKYVHRRAFQAMDAFSLAAILKSNMAA